MSMGNFNVIDSEIEKLEFWKKNNLITVIPAKLLFYTDYFVANADSLFVIANNDQIGIKKGSEMSQSDMIVFKSPSSKVMKNKLEYALNLLRQMQQADNLLKVINSNIMTESKNVSETKIRALQYLRRAIFSPKVATFSAVNAIFDMLKFETSDLALNQLKTRNYTETMRILERKRELEEE